MQQSVKSGDTHISQVLSVGAWRVRTCRGTLAKKDVSMRAIYHRMQVQVRPVRRTTTLNEGAEAPWVQTHSITYIVFFHSSERSLSLRATLSSFIL